MVKLKLVNFVAKHTFSETSHLVHILCKHCHNNNENVCMVPEYCDFKWDRLRYIKIKYKRTTSEELLVSYDTYFILGFFHKRTCINESVFFSDKWDGSIWKIRLKLTKYNDKMKFTNGHVKKSLTNQIISIFYTCIAHFVLWRWAYFLLRSKNVYVCHEYVI